MRSAGIRGGGDPMSKQRGPGRRRGIIMAEAGVAYSVTILLVLGTMIVGLGVFRYQEVAFQARQAARWASVQAGTPTPAQVLAGGITPIMIPKNRLTATVSKVTINSVDYISVTLTYRWTPEAFPVVLSPVTFSSTSKQPISP
jgi:predicted transporter